MRTVEIGRTYYDERNGRYVTPKSGSRKTHYKCDVEELNEDGEYESSDMELLTENEILKMQEV